MAPLFARLQSMILSMFPLIFFFIPLNQGYEEASVDFVVNGKVDKLQYLSNKYVREAPLKIG
jgi:hypothetical protein